MKELPFGDTYFGLDFGFSNPSAGLLVRIDREFNWWVFDGFYRRGLTNPDIEKLVDQDDEGNEVNFLVKEMEGLRWEETKSDTGEFEAKPVWGKQPTHAIDALTYILTTIQKPSPTSCRRRPLGS